MSLKTTFGPVASRRFGLSLGIDLSPKQKCCNFDCIYCELPKAPKLDTIIDPPSISQIISDIAESIEKHPNIEVLTITANGEPTLYRDLKQLIQEIRKNFSQKLMILSNASNIVKENIREVLKEFDEVKLSLDSVIAKTFKKIDRPIENNVDAIIKGIEIFNSEYKNLVIEILVVEGINDKPEEFHRLNSVLQNLDLKRVDIGTIDRPPAYDVSPVSNEKLEELGKLIVGQNINIVKRKKEVKRSFYSEEEIVRTLEKRPLSEVEVKTLFDSGTLENLKKLINSGVVEKVQKNSEIFYKKL